MKLTDLITSDLQAVEDHLMVAHSARPESHNGSMEYDAILINLARRVKEQGEIINELKLLLDRVESLIGGGIR